MRAHALGVTGSLDGPLQRGDRPGHGLELRPLLALGDVHRDQGDGLLLNRVDEGGEQGRVVVMLSQRRRLVLGLVDELTTARLDEGLCVLVVVRDGLLCPGGGGKPVDEIEQLAPAAFPPQFLQTYAPSPAEVALDLVAVAGD